MRFKTHFAFAFFISLLLKFGFVLILITLFSALLPDIDHPKSHLNKRFKITKIFSFLFRHRGLIHSLLFCLIISGIIYFLKKELAFAFLIGFLSHLFLDALTPEGINPLYPLKSKIAGPIKTSSLTESVLFLFLCLLITTKLLLWLL